MAKFKITLNMEFCRSADKGFEAGVRIAPDWMDDDWAHHVMRYTLTKTEQAARRHKVFICIEPHDLFTHTTPGLLKVVNLLPSPWIQINWNTGNSYLAGMEDPYEGLEKVRNKVYHIHAKDISIQHSEAERGKVTGTPGRLCLRRERRGLGAHRENHGTCGPRNLPQCGMWKDR